MIANSLTLLTQETNKEAELKAQFESKAMLAANLGAYKTQMVQLEQLVDTQLKQLPNTHEVAGLLDDISFIATDNGLKLNRINWGARDQTRVLHRAAHANRSGGHLS